MHTYVKAKDGSGWQAGYARTGPTSEHTVEPLGPVFETEAEAASLASYLNGGRWSPGELAEALPDNPEGATQAEQEEKAREERRTAEKGAQRSEPDAWTIPARHRRSAPAGSRRAHQGRSRTRRSRRIRRGASTR